MANHPTDPFTPAAARRWERIPQWAQKKILESVYCGQCVAPVPIVLETAEMVGKDLVLRGKCKNCGADICRVVEDDGERDRGNHR
jgi:hypothetical protein